MTKSLRPSTPPTGGGGLRCEALDAAYGPVVVCRQIDLHVPRGEIVCLIGPNGAGKTSCLLALAGLIGSRGTVWLDNQVLSGKTPHRRARMGLATVPDDRGLFKSLSVAENLALGARLAPKSERRSSTEEAIDIFPILKDLLSKVAGSLSGGEQQMLSIAKALTGRPEVLMLDEPTQGLAPIILDSLQESLTSLSRNGLPLLLVEQNHRFAAKVSDHFYVMVRGRIVLTGNSSELADRGAIAAAYLTDHVEKETDHA